MTEPGKETDKKEEVDIYRDTPLRYMGYCNEVGESFKAFLPKWAYLGTYAASIAYVSADTMDKSEYFKKPKIAGDVFLWQMAASVVIPGFTINTICKAVTKMGAPKPLVTAVGLGCIL